MHQAKLNYQQSFHESMNDGQYKVVKEILADIIDTHAHKTLFI